MPDFAPYLAAAELAARKAGAFLREQFYTVKQLDEALQHDIKLRLDKESQDLISAELLAAFPHSAILGKYALAPCPYFSLLFISLNMLEYLYSLQYFQYVWFCPWLYFAFCFSFKFRSRGPASLCAV